MSLLPRTTLHSDSEQYLLYFVRQKYDAYVMLAYFSKSSNNLGEIHEK